METKTKTKKSKYKPSEGSSLELLAVVERLSVLDETHIILGNVVDCLASGVNLSERELVVISRVQDVDEIGIERVQLLHDGETIQDGSEAVMALLLGELDLTSVERTNTRDLPSLADHSRGLSLRLAENDINEIVGRRHNDNLLEVFVHCEAKQVSEKVSVSNTVEDVLFL